MHCTVKYKHRWNSNKLDYSTFSHVTIIYAKSIKIQHKNTNNYESKLVLQRDSTNSHERV